MSRRPRFALLAAALLVVAVAGVWLALPRLAAGLIESRLAAAGLPGATVRVGPIGLGAAEVISLTTEDGSLSLTGVGLAYSLTGGLEAVSIAEVAVRGRWTAADGLDLGLLGDLLAADTDSGDEDAAAPLLPMERATVDRGTVVIALPEGELVVAASGTIERSDLGPVIALTAAVQAPGLTGGITFSGTASGAPMPATGEGQVRLTATAFAAPGIAEAVSGSLTATVRLGADAVTLAADAPVEVTVAALAPDLMALLSGFGGDGPLHLTLATATGAPPTATLTGLFEADGGIALTTDGLALVARRDDAAARIAAAGTLRLAHGRLSGALRGMEAAVEGITVGGTMPLRATLADGTLALTPEGLTATGTLTAEAAALALGGPTAGAARLTADLRLTATPSLTGAVFADSGSLVLEDLRLAEGITTTAPVALTLAAPQGPLLRLDRNPDGGPQVTLRAAFAAPSLALVTPQGPARVSFAQVDITAAMAGTGAPPVATVSGTGGGISIAGADLRDAALDAALAADGPALTLTGRLDALPGETPEEAAGSPLRPYRLTIQARPDQTAPNALAVTGDLRDVGNALVASARGRVSLGDGSGGLTVAVPRQVFDPQALRPGHLHGLLDTLGDRVSGAVAVDGNIAWTAAGALRPDLKVLLQDVNLSQGFVTLTRVNGVVTLTGLSPLRTAPRQQVSIAAVDAGLPLLDAMATFEIERDTLHLEDASATLAGGTIRARPTGIPLSLDGGGATLDVNGMGLGPLVDLAGIEGLRARGQLAGTVPLRFEAGDVIIDNAVLRSTMSERLVYQPEEVPAALAGGGESVDLVLQALRDFRYQDLSLTVDGRASGQMTVRLHIAGANPTFYDGYPVEFNLSISGELAKALQAGLSGYRVPDRIRERMEEFKVTP